MFELLRSSSPKQLLARHLPALGLSMLIAEVFYKLGSFTLECVAFLATWYAIDALFAGLANLAAGKPATTDDA